MFCRLLVTILSSTILTTASGQSDDSTQGTFVSSEANPWIMPRTEFGRPDFQGNWFFGSRTPLQRPQNLGEKQTYNEQEAQAIELSLRDRLARQDAPLDPNRDAPEKGARIGQEADDAFLGHYIAPVLVKVNGEYKTSVIVEPSNGRIPRREGFQDF